MNDQMQATNAGPGTANAASDNPFAPDAEGVKGSSTNFLQTPFLGSAKLKQIDIVEINNQEDNFNFEFVVSGENWLGDDVTGSVYTYTEWSPDPDATTEDIKKKVNRVGYIACQFVPEEKVLSLEPSSWSNYIQTIKQLMEQHNYAERDDIRIKVVGNTHNKPKARFPGYHDFITNPQTAKKYGKLEWSDKDQQENRKWKEAVQDTPSSPEDEELVDDLEEQTF